MCIKISGRLLKITWLKESLFKFLPFDLSMYANNVGHVHHVYMIDLRIQMGFRRSRAYPR